MKKIFCILLLLPFLYSCTLFSSNEEKDVVFYLNGSTIYHKMGCKSLVGKTYTPISKSAALEKGYSPCTTCNP